MDISKLFLWKTEYVIKGLDGKPARDENGDPIIVYIRIIGDNDLDQARRYALKESRKMREEYYKHPETIIPDLSVLSENELIALILLSEASEVYKSAERETTVPYPNEPTDLSIKSEEEYAEKSEKFFDELLKAIDENARKTLELRQKELEKFSRQQLENLVKKQYIDKLADDFMVKAYNDAIIYYSVYTDKEMTKRVFDSIDDAKNAATFLKNQLADAYAKLALKDIELKK